MTGHLDGTGPSGNLYARNDQIRDYCVANGKVLFDFADIESWDPGGVYYPDEDDENRPNPFNPVTRISFSLPEASRAMVEVFTMAGRKVATLVDGDLPAGEHTIEWDGADSQGRAQASGSYFCRLRAGDAIDVGKMLLLK